MAIDTRYGSSKITCLPSCAGCEFHEMGLGFDVDNGGYILGENGEQLFNHWCCNPKYAQVSGGGIGPTFELVPEICPKPPTWGKEPRPTFVV